MQNLPRLTAPQAQVQPCGSGFFAPHSAQNLPVLPVAPQAQSQPAAAGASGCCPIRNSSCARMPPAFCAMFMLAKPINAPADSFAAAAFMASACAPTRWAAAMPGLRSTALRCRSLIICSSSSDAVTELMPTETTLMPRSSLHLPERAAFIASASSAVWPGSAL